MGKRANISMLKIVRLKTWLVCGSRDASMVDAMVAELTAKAAGPERGMPAMAEAVVAGPPPPPPPTMPLGLLLLLLQSPAAVGEDENVAGWMPPPMPME